MTSEDVLNELSEAVQTEEVEFTEWEQGFIDEMVEWVGDGKDLTDTQEEKLGQIWQQRLNE